MSGSALTPSEAIDAAQNILQAIQRVPDDVNPLPDDLTTEARRCIRGLASHLTHHQQMLELRDALVTFLYARAPQVVIRSMAADAAVGGTQIRRIAQAGGVQQRRPSGHGKRAVTRRRVPIMPPPPATPDINRMYQGLLDPDSPALYPVDREQLALIREAHPEVDFVAQQSRAFLQRAVRTAARMGITQYLDIGCGWPTLDNTHEVAQRIQPGARIQYVDYDREVLATSRRIVDRTPGVEMIVGDLREPGAILAHPTTTGLIDLSAPVAVVIVAVLHWIDDEAVITASLSEIKAALAPGSLMIMTHIAREDDGGRGDDFTTVTRDATEGKIDPSARTRSQIEGFFDGLTMLAPGLVAPTRWRPDAPRLADTDPDTMWVLAGVGRRN